MDPVAMITSFFSAGVFYGAFCRLTHMSKRTRPSIRLAYSVLGTAAAAMALAPLIPEWGYKPSPLIAAMVGAQLIVMAAMARFWLCNGVDRLIDPD